MEGWQIGLERMALGVEEMALEVEARQDWQKLVEKIAVVAGTALEVED